VGGSGAAGFGFSPSFASFPFPSLERRWVTLITSRRKRTAATSAATKISMWSPT